MVIFDSLEKIAVPTPCAVALGLFDGVHKAHRAVLQAAADTALPLAVFTFRTDRAVPASKPHFEPLMTPEHRARVLESLGCVYLAIPEFDEFSALSPEAFAEHVLVERMNARAVCCGYDFRFGKNGAGDAALLCELGKRFGFSVHVTDCMTVGGIPVSSTAMRRALSDGDMALYRAMCGDDYTVTAPIRHGKALGRTLDFPTVNQPLDPAEKLPRFGVYVSDVQIGNAHFRGVSNIGIKPTVTDAHIPLCETHILGFHGDLYGQVISVRLLAFLRDEKKFCSVEELKSAIAADRDAAKVFEE